MTPDQALAWVNGGWRSSPYAKTETAGFGIDVDGQFGFQCVDFSTAYSIYLGAPFNSGRILNAITLWNNPQPGWSRDTCQAGNVFVADYYSGGVNYGHTGVVQSVTISGFYSIDQNWFNSSLEFGSPPARVYHTISFALGFLHCDSINDMSTVGPVELNDLSQAFFGYSADQNFINSWQGSETNTMIRWFQANSAHQAWVNRVNAAINANPVELDKQTVEDYINKNLS